MTNNWKAVLDKVDHAKAKAQQLYADMNVKEAANVLRYHGESVRTICQLVGAEDDPVIVAAMQELSDAMIAVSSDMTEAWEEAISSTPKSIKHFFWGGGIEDRIGKSIRSARYLKQLKEAPKPQEPLSNQDIITRVSSAISEEFSYRDFPIQHDDLTIDVPVEDGTVIEIRIRRELKPSDE